MFYNNCNLHVNGAMHSLKIVLSFYQTFPQYFSKYTPVNTECRNFSALYIFLRYSRFSNIRENMYNLKMTCIIPHSGNNIKSANFESTQKLPYFRKFAKMYTRENIYVHSIYK